MKQLNRTLESERLYLRPLVFTRRGYMGLLELPGY